MMPVVPVEKMPPATALSSKTLGLTQTIRAADTGSEEDAAAAAEVIFNEVDRNQNGTISKDGAMRNAIPAVPRSSSELCCSFT